MLSVEEINLLAAQNEGLKKQNRALQKELNALKKAPFFPYPLNSGGDMDFGEFVLISHAWCSFLNTPQQIGIIEIEDKNSGARKMYIGICYSKPTFEGFKNSVLQIVQYGTKIKETL